MSFAWSWSALENFETCPKKFWHARIKKDVVEPPGEAMQWGYKVHQAMADRIAKGRKLPDRYEHHIDDVMQNSDRTLVSMRVEQKLALTAEMRPCQYFDKQVDPWVRVVADVLKVRDDVGIARVVDWKTGKGKFYPDPVTGENKADSQQLELSAAVIMHVFPKVEMVWGQYYWLQEGVVTSETYSRAQIPEIWQRMLPRVDRMEAAYRTDEYPARPSGLCVRHCAVTSCPYHGRGSR